MSRLWRRLGAIGLILLAVLVWAAPAWAWDLSFEGEYNQVFGLNQIEDLGSGKVFYSGTMVPAPGNEGEARMVADKYTCSAILSWVEPASGQRSTRYLFVDVNSLEKDIITGLEVWGYWSGSSQNSGGPPWSSYTMLEGSMGDCWKTAGEGH